MSPPSKMAATLLPPGSVPVLPELQPTDMDVDADELNLALLEDHNASPEKTDAEFFNGVQGPRAAVELSFDVYPTLGRWESVHLCSICALCILQTSRMTLTTKIYGKTFVSIILPSSYGNRIHCKPTLAQQHRLSSCWLVD
eukprot:2821113-Pleurochrysis_carterae.AAC.3